MHPLSRTWTRLEASFWFVPALIVMGSIVAAIALVEADSLRTWKPDNWSPRLFGAGADGSRAMLSAIATSMITVAGVVFSITIVALSLTSTQYSPRVLRNFMRDRPTQAVLGVFVGIFAYCLVVLRTIRGGDEGAFIPSMAVLGGMLYAMAGIALLIFFIHHVALSIQASSILSRIADDTARAIDRSFPQQLGTAPREESRPATVPAVWTPLRAPRSGYVVAAEGDALVQLACESGRVLRLYTNVGEFVTEGQPIAALAGPEPVDAGCRVRVLACIQLESQRTVQQDAGYGLQQLVDVALRALSPAVNDPTTACMCVHQLAALAAQLARRDIPGPLRMHEGQLRVVAPTPDFGGWLATTFLPLVLHSRGDFSVLQSLVAAVELVTDALPEFDGRRTALQPIARQLQHALRQLPSRQLARPLHRRLRRLQFALDRPPAAGAVADASS